MYHRDPDVYDPYLKGHREALTQIAKNEFLWHYRNNPDQIADLRIRQMVEGHQEEKLYGKCDAFLITVNPPPDIPENSKYWAIMDTKYSKWKYIDKYEYCVEKSPKGRLHIHCVLITNKKKYPCEIHRDLWRHLSRDGMNKLHINVKYLKKDPDIDRALDYVNKEVVKKYGAIARSTIGFTKNQKKEKKLSRPKIVRKKCRIEDPIVKHTDVPIVVLPSEDAPNVLDVSQDSDPSLQ